MDKKVIYTLGYTLFQKGAFFDIEKMFRVLKEHGITCLIDVRSIPFSKQYPQCNSDYLKVAGRSFGVPYMHMPEVGAKASPTQDVFTKAGFGSSYLARIVGQKKAREIWFLCRQYSAKEAEEMGMVNKVVPIERLEDECVEWAQTMMERSPLALRMIKMGLNAELDGQAGIQQLAGDCTMLYYCMDEAQEGGRAFLEKRKPDFDQYPYLP